MAKTICFMMCAHHGIGDEIARAALAVGTSLPSQTSDASWPSPKGQSHRWLVDLVTGPSMQDVEPPAALGRFHAERPFSLPMAEKSVGGVLPSLTITKRKIRNEYVVERRTAQDR
jgi:hypothetical protein